ncbi:MAG: endolytic transglycosylase MltG [Chitinophagaceae bacterium]|jgi:UPF0755 protein|nr:endolytic transglycosylase MltG [Chitinophagaceae bacterium]
MRKKIVLVIVIAILAVIGVCSWLLFSSATVFSVKSKYLYVRNTSTAKEEILKQIDANRIIGKSRVALFRIVANTMDVWKNVQEGRFEIKKGQTVLDIVKMLRSNKQSPVTFTISHLRTAEDLGKILGKYFITDSAHTMIFLNNNDSLKPFNADTSTLLTLIIPGNYSIKWNTNVSGILQQFQDTTKAFWNKERLNKADSLKLTPAQVYILASIVEEETNKASDKGKIASVYKNRLDSGMALDADPTVKFALRNFELKRISFEQLKTQSPYNTYTNKGLPPGPICTPSTASIDSTLNMPKTNYLFFTAKPDFSGYSNFAATYEEHLQNAKAWREALDERAKQVGAP